jgi:pimeloyl-ACP methyl ester carboxylesterase
MAVTPREQNEVDRANREGQPPVVFIHGLWLLASSWDPWSDSFREKGYATLTPGWPGDPETVEVARRTPSAFAGVSIGEVTDHLAAVIGKLQRKPILIGHSFGGLLAQKLAGEGRAAGSVAIDPAPFRGVLPLPLSALKASSPVLRNPANRNKAVTLTEEQFRYAFTNAVPEAEAKDLYERYAVACPGKPLFQAAFANINPKTEASVDTKNPDRGPLLIISGEHDHTVPWKIANASYHRYKDPNQTTEITEIKGRGHSLTIDSGWPEVADTALAFLARNGLAP